MKSNLIKKTTKKEQLPPAPRSSSIPEGELSAEDREKLYRKLKKEWITNRQSSEKTFSSLFKDPEVK